MNLIENKNFKSIEIYETLNLKDVLNTLKTEHLKDKRKERLDLAISLLDNNDYIEYTFLIDKNHIEGKELHCITHSGIIFILNEYKYNNNIPCFITVLLARPNQIKRLYEPFNLHISNYTLKKTKFYIYNNMNK